MTAHDTGWWTIHRWGWYGPLDIASPPVGPWRSEDEARDALARWVRRAGADGGSAVAAMNIRVAGPFGTRAQARASHR